MRIETTANNVSFFKHHRKVEHRDGTTTTQFAPVRKTIYSLGVLRELLGAANRRYVEFVSALDAPHTGIRQLEKVARPVRYEGRNYRGFNLLHGEDLALFQTIVRREFAISGLRSALAPNHRPPSPKPSVV